jgi:hypothetical protein
METLPFLNIFLLISPSVDEVIAILQDLQAMGVCFFR